MQVKRQGARQSPGRCRTYIRPMHSLWILILRGIHDNTILGSSPDCTDPSYLGRPIAQVVNRRLPTAAAGVQSQVRSCGICNGQSGIGAGCLRVAEFLLPILIPPTTPQSSSSSSSSIIRSWYNRPNSGRYTKWTQSHPAPRN
jgi:hypothetical protein